MSKAKPTVFCASPCGKTPNYDLFYDAFWNLQLPPGSQRGRVTGGSVPANLNKACQDALEHKCSHLFIVEDDSWFEKDTVTKLLKHDKPVVTGLCRSRQWPFRPYIYSGIAEDQSLGLEWYDLTPADKGLIKCGATGMGGILVNLDVLKKLKYPYFETYYHNDVEWGQDIVFGKKLIEAGVDVYCDLDTIIWHKTECVLGTEKAGDDWLTVVKINKGTVKLNIKYEPVDGAE